MKFTAQMYGQEQEHVKPSHHPYEFIGQNNPQYPALGQQNYF